MVDNNFIVGSISPVLSWGVHVHLSYLKSWDFHKVPQEKGSCCDGETTHPRGWTFPGKPSEVRAGCVLGADLQSFCRMGCALTQVCGLSGVSPVQCFKKSLIGVKSGGISCSPARNGRGKTEWRVDMQKKIKSLPLMFCGTQGCGASQPDGQREAAQPRWLWNQNSHGLVVDYHILARKKGKFISTVMTSTCLKHSEKNQQTHLGLRSQDEKREYFYHCSLCFSRVVTPARYHLKSALMRGEEELVWSK